MSWASKRRFIVFSIVGAFIAAVLAILLISIFYQAPSCTDRKQNQDETGIDCGGSCSYLCTASVGKATPRFARYFSPQQGRTDVIAYVDNPNSRAAAVGVRYTVELYAMDNTVVAKKEGILELPPSATVPVYVPNFFSGYQEVKQAFLTIDADSFRWFPYEDDRIVPIYRNDAVVTGTDRPRVTATLENPSAYPLRDITVIATLFDASGNAFSASQTVVPYLAPQASANATFTWNEPFPSVPVRIDVVPVVPLKP
ncbi:MAG TPA: FxLYD domain-containing protein [Candidatus Paceibacterota bacterium]|nr:FxLYD domain-containing protein [Candidatus Paceibacterota bacterium]